MKYKVTLRNEYTGVYHEFDNIETAHQFAVMAMDSSKSDSEYHNDPEVATIEYEREEIDNV